MKRVLVILILSVIVLGAITTVGEQGENKSTQENYRGGFTVTQVSENSPEANEIFLSRSENGIFYMGWNDYRSVGWSGGYVHLGFSYSTDGGKTWSQNQILGNSSDNDFHDAAGDPVVVPGNGNDVYYFLMEFNSSERNLAHSQLVVRKSADHGETWSDEALIWPYDVDKPWATFWNGNLYVAWDNVSTYRTEFSRTTDGTIHSWTQKIEIPGYNLYPGIAVNETGAIFIATVHYDFSTSSWDQLAVSVSTDGGKTFSQTIVGSVGSNSWEDKPRSGPIPQIAAQGKDVYAIWASNQTYSQVYMAESHDGGSTWNVNVVGTQTATHIRYMYPSVSISPSGLVHLMYYRLDNSSRVIDVIYRNYTQQSGFSSEWVVDSWTTHNSFIGDYATIVADRFGNVSLGYTTENPGDNAMFATMSLPLRIESVTNSSENGFAMNHLNVSAVVSSADSVKNVHLYYRFENETNYTVMNMSLISGSVYSGTWNATINLTGHSGRVYYYVFADDGFGKNDTSQVYSTEITAVPELWIPVLIAIPALFAMVRKR